MSREELPVVEERCGTCRFFFVGDPDYPHWGQCRRYPPAVPATDKQQELDESVYCGVWPELGQEDWCGEWQAKGRTPPAPAPSE